MKPLTAVTHFSYWVAPTGAVPMARRMIALPPRGNAIWNWPKKYFRECALCIAAMLSSYRGQIPPMWVRAGHFRRGLASCGDEAATEISLRKKHFRRKLRCRRSMVTGSRLRGKLWPHLPNAADFKPSPGHRQCTSQTCVVGTRRRWPARLLVSQRRCYRSGRSPFIEAGIAFSQHLDARHATTNDFVHSKN